MIRIDLSPPDFIHVPQAPRIERRTFCTRNAGNEWHMWTAGSVTAEGERLGLSNHTWSHLDAPFHLLPRRADRSSSSIRATTWRSTRAWST